MIKNFKVTSTSLVSAEGLQKTIINFLSDENRLLTAAFYVGGKAFGRSFSLKATAGEVSAQAMLPEAATEESAECVIFYENGEEAARTAFLRKVPRKWNLYAMVSSHTDIGLHNSQYIQRENSVRFLQKAASLVDETADFPEEARYRYTVEGTWFFGNYPAEKGSTAAREIVEKYISKGDIGVCCGVAGNHVQTYGYEEMCISAYERKRLFDNWGVKSQTLSMIDNNGMPHSMIQPYAEAGYKNIIFAPNQWNPLPSTIVKRDESVWGYEWNPEARGGGSRIDVNYSSPLPMLFNWSDGEGHSLTVWCSTAYDWGGAAFGVRAFYPHFEKKEELEKVIRVIEEKTTIQLENLEKRYLYDLWFFACYGDDLEPNTGLSEVFREWNTRWKNPKFSTVGDPDPLFDEVRAKWGKAIPELKGDITGGWYQHPLTVPEIMSKKYEADRLLPIAEKWSSVACMLDENYLYPAEKFRRAWDALLFNDEHSYGTSGYQGRRVYETWIQHKDWVKKAFDAAAEEIERATKSIAAFVNTQVGDRLVFNPTNFERRELVEDGTGGYALCSIPPFGCKVVKKSEFERFENVQKTTTVPVIENDYYKITFSSCGGMVSIYDKVLKIELLTKGKFCADQLLYTRDNHKTFSSPKVKEFIVTTTKYTVSVTAVCDESCLRAEVRQTVTLYSFKKIIAIKNEILHASDMINDDRYKRYLYYTFPFEVENCKRYCNLNGVVAEYGKDITGHGTDSYMAVRDFACVENAKTGVALFTKDYQLTEFDKIHPDKTEYGILGGGSNIFSYFANDWLQMHSSGGSRQDYRLEYAITSYIGDYKAAGVPRLAEEFVTPLQTVNTFENKGGLGESITFIAFDTLARFIGLKRADDGKGFIARFLSDGEKINFGGIRAERVTIDERSVIENKYTRGFISYRLFGDKIFPKTKKADEPVAVGGAPLPIGSVYTGLIDKPRAGTGEGSGKIYLLWGASKEEDFSHYELYRSKVSGFALSEENLIAEVYPEEFVVGRYEDCGLEDNTEYFYRVRAVNKKGVKGEASEEFGAFTREPLEKKR